MVHESGGDSFEGCGVGDDCIACVVEEGYRDKNRNRFKIKGAYGLVTHCYSCCFGCYWRDYLFEQT